MGGQGSGNFGHPGRPGEVGGSSAAGSNAAPRKKFKVTFSELAEKIQSGEMPPNISARYDMAESATGKARGTLKNYTYLARHAPPEVRALGMSNSHMMAVASLHPVHQKAILEYAKEHLLSVMTVRRMVAGLKRDGKV